MIHDCSTYGFCFPSIFPANGANVCVNNLAYIEHIDDGGWWRMFVSRKLPTPLSCTDRLPVDPDPASPEVYGNFKNCHLEQWTMLDVT